MDVGSAIPQPRALSKIKRQKGGKPSERQSIFSPLPVCRDVDISSVPHTSAVTVFSPSTWTQINMTEPSNNKTKLASFSYFSRHSSQNYTKVTGARFPFYADPGRKVKGPLWPCKKVLL